MKTGCALGSGRAGSGTSAAFAGAEPGELVSGVLPAGGFDPVPEGFTATGGALLPAMVGCAVEVAGLETAGFATKAEVAPPLPEWVCGFVSLTAFAAKAGGGAGATIVEEAAAPVASAGRSPTFCSLAVPLPAVCFVPSEGAVPFPLSITQTRPKITATASKLTAAINGNRQELPSRPARSGCAMFLTG